MKQIIYSLLFLCFYPAAYSQTITADTTLANQYFDLASKLKSQDKYDSALFYLEKVQTLYIRHLGEKNLKNSKVLILFGNICDNESKYENALQYYFKALAIQKELLNEKHIYIANSFSNIGIVYWEKAEYEKALEYYFNSLSIRRELLGEKHTDIAKSYNNIGNVYADKGEYDKALEYLFKGLTIRKELFGEKHILVAVSYYNIGGVYDDKTDYNKALVYYFKALTIQKEILGEKHTNVSVSYNNIGITFFNKTEYDSALVYYFKALTIQKELLGENHIYVANSYNNIGNAYLCKFEFDKALEYNLKGLAIKKELLGVKHNAISACYNDIGQVFIKKKDYTTALEYCQKAIASSLRNYDDTVNIFTVPTISNYLEWNELLKALQAKAQILSKKTYQSIKNIDRFEDRLKLALRHYQATDTLINQVRETISTESDKLALAEKASSIYTEAIAVCLELSNVSKSSDYYKKLVFYFSEKNKSIILQESLANKNGLAYSGIPDSLLTKEHSLRTDIKLFQSKLAEGQDSVNEIQFRNKLFAANQTYDSLIKNFEKNYPAYYNLKHNIKTATIENLQKTLDGKTQIRNYTMADSVMYISTISQKKFEIIAQKIPITFADSVHLYRFSLDYVNGNLIEHYKRLGVWLFNILFPDFKNIDKKIKNLVIIPDDCLTSIPFETLLIMPIIENQLTVSKTNTVTNSRGEGFKEIKKALSSNNFWEYPYLLKNFSVSYSYSATLWYSNLYTNNRKVQILNDFIALAPVFSDKDEQDVLLASQNYVNQMQQISTDSLQIRGKAIDGHHISPLPATEIEVKTIFKYFNDKKLKAVVRLHKNANEAFVKSSELQNFRIIHFATHGFVNSEKPDLSGILLAQDSTGGQDGILYASEIFNLKLNADLTVLSACETGLGKIRKGEGLIGLTRSLMFAGSKNVLVSLWPVDDSATALEMIGFYNKLVNIDNNKSEFKDCLRYAKLKLLESRKYAHPYYWSPFILVGQ